MAGEQRFLAEVGRFLKHSKKWWLGPIVVFLALLTIIIFLTDASSVAPFVYALF